MPIAIGVTINSKVVATGRASAIVSRAFLVGSGEAGEQHVGRGLDQLRSGQGRDLDRKQIEAELSRSQHWPQDEGIAPIPDQAGKAGQP